jgi:hypothetical protein
VHWTWIFFCLFSLWFFEFSLRYWVSKHGIHVVSNNMMRMDSGVEFFFVYFSFTFFICMRACTVGVDGIWGGRMYLIDVRDENTCFHVWMKCFHVGMKTPVFM